MRMKLIFLALSLVLFLSGCANPNLVGLRGDAPDSTYSLQDRRAAKQHIQVFSSLPPDVRVLGEVSVERCHQYAQDTPPSDETLTDDLIYRAFADGADGIANISFLRRSGLMHNCWHIATGTATFFVFFEGPLITE